MDRPEGVGDGAVAVGPTGGWDRIIAPLAGRVEAVTIINSLARIVRSEFDRRRPGKVRRAEGQVVAIGAEGEAGVQARGPAHNSPVFARGEHYEILTRRQYYLGESPFAQIRCVVGQRPAI